MAESDSVFRRMARDSEAVKKKWSNINSAAKKKEDERQFMWSSWRRRLSSMIEEMVVEGLRDR